MRTFATLLLALLAIIALPGASEADDRGVLQAWLEDNLSDAGREVQITGFAGALSGRATLEQLTIADDQGIWLTIDGLVFDWRRGRLGAGMPRPRCAPLGFV